MLWIINRMKSIIIFVAFAIGMIVAADVDIINKISPTIGLTGKETQIEYTHKKVGLVK